MMIIGVVLVKFDMYYWLMGGKRGPDVTVAGKSSIRTTIRKVDPYRKMQEISDIIAEIGTSLSLFVEPEGLRGNKLAQLVEERCFTV
jgi:hypothetical protein